MELMAAMTGRFVGLKFMSCVGLCLAGALQAAVLPTPPLPYAADALEPFLAAPVVQQLYERQTAPAFRDLNAVIADYGLAHEAGMTAEDYCRLALVFSGPMKAEIMRSAGAAANSQFFWEGLSRRGGGEPGGMVMPALRGAYGSFRGFQQAFREAALSLRGDGWVWLCAGQRGRVFIYAAPGHHHPLMGGEVPEEGFPLLVLNLWEEAYGSTYGNDRGAYVDAFWSKVDWETVGERFAGIARYR